MPTRARLPVYRSDLTDRQREVLSLIARGRTNFEIATALGISLETVKYHVTEILTRLNVSTREEAVAVYVKQRSPATRMRGALSTFVRPWAMAAGGLGALVIVTLAVLIILRGGGDESPTTPPQSETTATVTTAATPTMSPDTPVPTRAPGMTGVADVDSVLTVLRSGDAARIEELMQPQTLPCTTRVGLGGPPKCPDGVADRTMVTAFPSSISALWWSLDWSTEARTLAGATTVVAVYRSSYVPFDSTRDDVPSGEFVVVMTSQRMAPTSGARLVDIHAGRILHYSNGGYAPLEEILARVPPGDFLLPPP